MSRLRRNLIAVIAIAAIAIGGLVLAHLGYLKLPGQGAAAIHDPASLPDRISMCGRFWDKDPRGMRFSKSQLVETYGSQPKVVDPDSHDCQSGACGATTCDTLIWVRVGEDAYIGYSLLGGP